MESFRLFYQENRERLYGYLLRKSGCVHLAADLVQEAFVRYWERYRHRELSVALLFTIARNSFFDHARNQRRPSALAEMPAEMAEDQERLYIVREETSSVLAALQQLDEEDRDILSLVISSGLAYREIAAIRGCSEANIKVRVHRARQQLRQLLAEEEQ